jgi:cellulose synthase/poly-beta-1,6-N-acetylglucosamine synthase-like glycosyltransferase
MLVYWAAMVVIIVLNLAVVPYFLFLAAIALAAILARPQNRSHAEPRARFAIVVPAHNEAAGIAATVQSCLAVDYPRALFRVIVIADNCTDQTAELAAEAGAEVVERFDQSKKSKGYAIEHLLDNWSATGKLDASDALVLIDADTTVDRELLREFQTELSAGRDWIQCYYTVADPDRTWRTRLMNFAFSLFNGVTPLGQNALGCSAGFRGNGMCLSTRGLANRPWKAFGLVEDMDYSWSIRVAGEWIAFLPRCRVYGAMPSTGLGGAADQRRRWEFGRGEIRRQYLGPLLASRHIGAGAKLMSFFELTIPSMAWLAILCLAVTILNIGVFAAPATRELPVSHWGLVASSVIMMCALGVYALSPFLALGLPWKYARSIAFFPAYLIWKLLVLRRGRPRQWVRTAREPEISQTA